MAQTEAPQLVVMMGVSGSGKTTIGALLASKTGALFADADDYHTPENKAKMAAGSPLTDEDRAPWLEALNRLLQGWSEKGVKGVLACSALRETYRQTLNSGLRPKELAYVWLDGSPEMIAARLQARKGTFMNPSLLGSQFATLEAPSDALRVVNDRTPDEVAGEVSSKLGWA